jgi:hypothetical protein
MPDRQLFTFKIPPVSSNQLRLAVPFYAAMSAAHLDVREQFVVIVDPALSQP